MATPDIDFSRWSGEDLREQAEIVSRQLDELPARIRTAHASGSAGHGSVVAFADGTGTLTRVTMDTAAIRDTDARSLGRMVVTAIGRAEEAARAARHALLDEMTFAGRPILDWLPDSARSAAG
jgi:DNA-binding protein YbaB